jgi:hypothetical protein
MRGQEAWPRVCPGGPTHMTECRGYQAARRVRARATRTRRPTTVRPCPSSVLLCAAAAPVLPVDSPPTACPSLWDPNLPTPHAARVRRLQRAVLCGDALERACSMTGVRCASERHAPPRNKTQQAYPTCIPPSDCRYLFFLFGTQFSHEC